MQKMESSAFRDLDEADEQHAADLEEAEAEYPELMFVPIKATEPTVPALQFLIYIFMLVMFSINVQSQHLQGDYEANQGIMQGPFCCAPAG